MESKRIYHIQRKRFITMVMFYYGTVKSFCEKAGISRNRFYVILRRSYTTKKPESFVKLFNLLDEAVEGGHFDYEIFWGK